MKIKKYSGISVDNSQYIVSMRRLNLLQPGTVVTGTTVENILGVKYLPEDWNFIGKYMILKSQLEALGFFVTQADLDPPSFRLLKTEEMAEFAAKRLMKAMGMNYKTALVMSNHDASALDEREKKRYDAMKTKAASIALYQQKVLLDDFMFE